MDRTPLTDAILLLNVDFAKRLSGRNRPLTVAQYRELAKWLVDRNQTPADLLTGDRDGILADWSNAELKNKRVAKPCRERIERLLGRGIEMGRAMEKWERAGLWALTRAHAELYPLRLRERLGSNSHPVMFGCGNASLLRNRGVAVVGSRDASEEELEYSRKIGAHATSEGAVVVSGGAKGVDLAAMTAALESGGGAIGVMAEGVLRPSSFRSYIEFIEAGRLTLLSPYGPEARWSPIRAVSRNKLIYCLSDAALVVASVEGSGGTWQGATENLKRNWVPLWAKTTDNPESGNSALIRKGGRWLRDSNCPVQEMLNPRADESIGPLWRNKP